MSQDQEASNPIVSQGENLSNIAALEKGKEPANKNQAQTPNESMPNPDQNITDKSLTSKSVKPSLQPDVVNSPGKPQVNNVSSNNESNLDLIMGIPVTVQVILGATKMPVSKIMQLGRNAIIPLDRNVGDPIDVVINGRTVARGEVVLMENDDTRFGISITELVTN